VFATTIIIMKFRDGSATHNQAGVKLNGKYDLCYMANTS